MLNQKRPFNPIQILHLEESSAEKVPKGDLEKAWFLYHHAFAQAGENFFIRSILHSTTTLLFTIALMLIVGKGQLLYITVGIGLGICFLQTLKAYRNECLKITSQVDYYNCMTQLIRKNDRGF